MTCRLKEGGHRREAVVASLIAARSPALTCSVQHVTASPGKLLGSYTFPTTLWRTCAVVGMIDRGPQVPRTHVKRNCGSGAFCSSLFLHHLIIYQSTNPAHRLAFGYCVGWLAPEETEEGRNGVWLRSVENILLAPFCFRIRWARPPSRKRWVELIRSNRSRWIGWSPET